MAPRSTALVTATPASVTATPAAAAPAPRERGFALLPGRERGFALLPGRERGFALLIVLWTLALLAVLGVTITAAGRSETRIAGNLLAAATATAAADGAVAAAAYHFLDATHQHWAPDGSHHRLRIGDTDLDVVLHDQAGEIDPDEAPPGLIAALLRVQGIGDQQATDIANAIVDWRSPADAGLGPLYQAQHRRFGPPHEPFQSLDELGLVAGVTPAIVKLLRPHMDIFIQSTPDPTLADPVVAAAIDAATKRDHLLLNPVGDGGPSVIAVTIVATQGRVGQGGAGQGGAGGGKTVFRRSAVLRFNAVPDRAYEVLAWTSP